MYFDSDKSCPNAGPSRDENTGKAEKSRVLRRKIIFICSPYAGDIDINTQRARRYGRFAILKNAIPFIPHLLYPQLLDDNDEGERALGISMGIEVLSVCDEVWVFGDRISKGMEAEIRAAKRLGIPVRYFTDRCEERRGVELW